MSSEHLPEFKAPTSVIVAAMFGKHEYVQYLFDNGEGINEKDPITDLPIHVAVYRTKYLEVIQILIDHGGDIHAENA